ncbi:hypothetical protein [uncultured Maribacter sp.]|uniref:hypothetical protein n=1 Tax=uncultured Maribacter sp. TaxID=431308 RepID=UPI00260E7B48|nr:hypothetical protein [uncultured Maribacter sp.]
MRILGIIILTFFVLSCKKSDPPKPPGSTQLSYPDKNSECTTGISISDTSSEVEFRWSTAENTDTYTLSVTNQNTGFTQTTNTSATKLKVPIDKGTPYTWFVVTKNNKVSETSTSDKWAFYNSGFVSAFVPFPAEILFPKIGDNAFIDLNNEVTLDWSGADLDNDIDGYDLYFSTSKPPTTLLVSTTPSVTEQKVTVEANTIYYWKVITKDKEGNTSDSGVFSFKAL